MNHEKTDNKNVAKSSFEETKVDDGFFILTYKNESIEIQTVAKEIDSDYIQFHFCVKGSSHFVFNEGRYRLNILEENSLLLYNPQRNLPINLEINPHSWMVSVLISIKKFHGLFSQEADYISFLSEDNKDKKYICNKRKATTRVVAFSFINKTFFKNKRKFFIARQFHVFVATF